MREVWGLQSAATVSEGSALVEWEYGLEEPVLNLPPTGEDPHESPRRELAGQQQIAWFFETGEIKNFCEGECLGD